MCPVVEVWLQCKDVRVRACANCLEADWYQYQDREERAQQQRRGNKIGG
jgi:hypothetical protein